MRLWESLGKQLASKGEEYKKRCAFRNRPRHDADYAIPPGFFKLGDTKRKDSPVSTNLLAGDQKDVSGERHTFSFFLLNAGTRHHHSCISSWCKPTSSLTHSEALPRFDRLEKYNTLSTVSEHVSSLPHA